MNAGCERIDAGKPIDLELIRELHAILMPGTRGGDRKPGQFRDEQNWIGHPGSTAVNARYVPPPVERMHMALAILAYYICEHQGHAPLIRCAIAHAQFETIHPFHDGNGRMGRLLVALMLKRDMVLEAPLLYVSLYLQANRQEYFDRLTALRRNGDWAGWLDFFCQAAKHTADDALDLADRVTALQAEIENLALDLPANAKQLAPRLFYKPVLDAKAVQQLLGCTFDTAAKSLRRFEQAGVLDETTGQRRNKRYRFSRYMDILDGAGEHDR